MLALFNDFLAPPEKVLELVIRSAVVFSIVLLMLRLAGKRQVAQMGMSEFVALMLISNAVQNSMNGGDNSLVGGLVAAAVIVVMGWSVQWLSFRSRGFEAMIQGRPTLLIHHGEIQYRHLRKELMTVRELKTILRKQGVHALDDVDQAVLESDGSVSLIKKGESATRMGMEDINSTAPTYIGVKDRAPKP